MSERQSESHVRSARITSAWRCVLLLVLACGCFSSHGSNAPSTSTETGNPPVLDPKQVALEITADAVHITGNKGSVKPGGSTVEITNLATGKVTSAKAASDGSFDVQVSGSPNDTFVVRAQSDGKGSSSVYVVRGAAAVGEQGSALSCDARNKLAGSLIETAAANADKRCTVDSECRAMLEQPSCHEACQYAIVSQSGEHALTVTSATLDNGVCSRYLEDGCKTQFVECVAPPAVTCADGQCALATNPGTLSCKERENMAGTQLATAISSADTHCLIDTDCTTTSAVVSCHDSCSPDQVVAKVGESALDAEVARIDRDVCGNFKGDGCSFELLPCAPPLQGAPGCQNGQCVRKSADQSSCVTCLDQTISWGYGRPGVRDSLGLGSMLQPCAHYTRTALVANVAEPISCQTDLTACNAVTSTGAVLSVITNVDVQQALAKAPVVYGMDQAGYSLFKITIGGREIDVGAPCDPSAACAIPTGVQALVDLLQAVDAQLSSSMECSILADPGSCPPDRKYARVCTACGLGGGCASYTTECAKVCSQNSDCAGAGNASFCTADQVCEIGGCI